MDNSNNIKPDSRKRQRIEDAFSSLTIDSDMVDNCENGNSSDALSMGYKMRSSSSDNGVLSMSTSNGLSSTTYTTDTSNTAIWGDVDYSSDDNDDMSSVAAPTISAEEKQALYNLVFGSNKSRKVGVDDSSSVGQRNNRKSYHTHTSSVDAKIEEIIRKSRLQASVSTSDSQVDNNATGSATSMEMENHAEATTSNRYLFNPINAEQDMTTESPRFSGTPSHGDFISEPTSSNCSHDWSNYREKWSTWSNVSSFGDSSTGGVELECDKSGMDCM
eukprot:CAMPEP_0196817082 /NCGR_PEP_ID=MMETSP1362-20130617/58678_1 /TAXON_ID=163516 /ORGANISM="Leptocylindrus danicus, Strain CCMP1856" /LENGTH=273 /DNA_ID=CAMNT_0042194639 /DNA_START=169 /DNA_END=993 /DNA_ORIENTATION=-